MEHLIQKYGIAPALTLSAGIVLSACIASYTLFGVYAMSNTLSVTGSATATSTADSATLSITVSRGAFEGSTASVQRSVAEDVRAVSRFLEQNGIADDSISIDTMYTDREYSSNENAPRRYTVRQTISIHSNDPYAIEKLSKDALDLSARGINLQINQPQYFISNLPELRIALVGKAVTDAKARAESIAESAGQRVGSLQSAASGVVQVLAPNSIEVADYGSYDTSTIEKIVMVTTKAVFQVR
jgi:uncharacterized protein